MMTRAFIAVLLAGGPALSAAALQPDELNTIAAFREGLVGADQTKDIAVLRIEESTEKLKPIPVGEAYKLQVGQQTLAIGNPFGLDHSLSKGVISALGPRSPLRPAVTAATRRRATSAELEGGCSVTLAGKMTREARRAAGAAGRAWAACLRKIFEVDPRAEKWEGRQEFPDEEPAADWRALSRNAA